MTPARWSRTSWRNAVLILALSLAGTTIVSALGSGPKRAVRTTALSLASMKTGAALSATPGGSDSLCAAGQAPGSGKRVCHKRHRNLSEDPLTPAVESNSTFVLTVASTPSHLLVRTAVVRSFACPVLAPRAPPLPFAAL